MTTGRNRRTRFCWIAKSKWRDADLQGEWLQGIGAIVSVLISLLMMAFKNGIFTLFRPAALLIADRDEARRRAVEEKARADAAEKLAKILDGNVKAMEGRVGRLEGRCDALVEYARATGRYIEYIEGLLQENRIPVKMERPTLQMEADLL
jgi:hypothetical protein